MASRERRIGGCFAPPFTDEMLEQYKKLTKKLPESPVKDAINYIFPGNTTWWDLPGPAITASKKRHPIEPRMMIVDLEPEHKAVLDPLIPWPHELDAIGGAQDSRMGLFDTIEIDATLRNAPKCQDWVRRVFLSIIASNYSDQSEYERVWAAEHNREKWWGVVSKEEQAKFESALTKAKKCCDQIVKAVSSKECEGVPRPVLESTPIRDMACHLLWHIRELDLGREPLTMDKLGLI